MEVCSTPMEFQKLPWWWGQGVHGISSESYRQSWRESTFHLKGIRKGWVYETCLRSAMLYCSELWVMKTDQEAIFERTEMSIIRWMFEVFFKWKKTSAELWARIRLEPGGEEVRENIVRWLEHVLRKYPDDWVQECLDFEVGEKRPIGRPDNTGKDLMGKKARMLENWCDAIDRERWRSGIHVCKWPCTA